MDTHATVIFISNPYKPLEDTETCRVIGGRYTVRKWLRRRFKGFKEFHRPTLCLLNGKPLPRKCWGRKIRGGDVLNFVTLAGAPAVAVYWLIAAVVVAAVVVSLHQNITVPNPSANAADPVYTLRGQRNQNRLGQPIEVPYGLNRLWPSYAAQPYNEYIDNNQWLYQLFCLGQGEYDISEIRIGDTAVGDLQDVTTEVIPPGSPVTLFPINVKVSPDVAGLELLGSNQGGLDGTNVTDSEGDGSVGIPATDHPAYLSAGPYVANDANTQTNKIAVDFVLPNGLYSQGSSGALTNLTVSAIVEARTIDNAGVPTSGWSTIISFSKTMNTTTPQRFTLSATVALGRYQVRASRTNASTTVATAADKLIWEGLRAYIPDDTVDDGVTKLAVKARATNNLNDQSAQLVNVIATRKTRVWDTMTSAMSTGVVANRSPVWAFVDVFTAKYGGRLADALLDLDALVALDTTLAGRNEYFDWVFDQKVTVWEAARLIGATVRAVPMLNGSRITLVRDGVKSFPVAIFNQENIVRNSFKWQLKLVGRDDPSDGLLVTYKDPSTYKDETVLCCMPDEDGNNPDTLVLAGVSNRDHAYRTGMYLRRVKRMQNENYVFTTGMEGHIPSYGDMVGVAHDIPEWTEGGLVKTMTKASAGGLNYTYTFVLKPGQPITSYGGTKSLLLRKNDGSVAGPYLVSYVAQDTVVTSAAPADSALDALTFDDVGENPTFLFGDNGSVAKEVRVTGLAPGPDDTVQVTAVPYTDDLFTEENGTAPAIGDTHGSLPTPGAGPDIDGLRVSRAPIDEYDGGLWVQANWFPARGAKYYVVQFSYNAVEWSEVTTTTDIKAMLQVTKRYLYVRVAAVAEAQGEWAYWTGQAPIIDTSVVAAPTGGSLTNVGVLQADGTTVPRVQCSWTAPANDPLVTQSGYGGKYRLQWKKTTDSTYLDWSTPDGSVTTDYVTDVKSGTAYDFRVRSENKWGGVSSWLSLGSITVAGDTTGPATPSGLAFVTGTGKSVSLSWNRNTEIDLDEYIVQRSPDNSTWAEVGRVTANRFVDVNVSIGSPYYYRIAAKDWSANSSTFTSSVGPATPGTIGAGSVDSTPPSNPAALTVSSSGSRVAGDGTIISYFIVNVPSMPTGGIGMNIFARVHGDSDWVIYNQVAAGGGTSQIDGLTPGKSYDLGVQAFSAFGYTSSIVALNSQTAPNTTTAPATPSGGNLSSKVVAWYDVSFANFAFGCAISWSPNTEPDFDHYELKATLTDSDGATDYTWYPPDGLGARLLVVQETTVTLYNGALTSGYVRVRAINRSGLQSPWYRIGQANGSASIGNLGNAALRNIGTSSGTAAAGDDSRITGAAQKSSNLSDLGSASTARQNLRVRDASHVFTLTGGSPTENFTYTHNFGAQYNTILADVIDGLGNLNMLCKHAYSNGGNDSNHSVFTVCSIDGTNLPANTIRVNMHFLP